MLFYSSVEIKYNEFKKKKKFVDAMRNNVQNRINNY